eukprot:scaffold436102_cov34-Prasinocladus_malaysianus.AAC.1
MMIDEHCYQGDVATLGVRAAKSGHNIRAHAMAADQSVSTHGIARPSELRPRPGDNLSIFNHNDARASGVEVRHSWCDVQRPSAYEYEYEHLTFSFATSSAYCEARSWAGNIKGTGVSTIFGPSNKSQTRTGARLDVRLC